MDILPTENLELVINVIQAVEPALNLEKVNALLVLLVHIESLINVFVIMGTLILNYLNAQNVQKIVQLALV
jgi:hypothetical protein